MSTQILVASLQRLRKTHDLLNNSVLGYDALYEAADNISAAWVALDNKIPADQWNMLHDCAVSIRNGLDTENYEKLDYVQAIATLTKVISLLEKNNHVSLGSAENWQEKLELLKKKFSSEQVDAHPEQDEVITNDDAFRLKESTTKIRLLKGTEEGLIQIPVILMNTYLSDYAWRLLEETGTELSHLFESYLLISNAYVYGIVSWSYNVHNVDDFQKVIMSEVTQKVKQPMGVFGDLQNRGHHIYGLLLPSELANDRRAVIGTWNFAEKSRYRK